MKTHKDLIKHASNALKDENSSLFSTKIPSAKEIEEYINEYFRHDKTTICITDQGHHSQAGIKQKYVTDQGYYFDRDQIFTREESGDTFYTVWYWRPICDRVSIHIPLEVCEPQPEWERDNIV